MQIPRLTKIVVNMGVGEATRDAKLMDGAVRDLTAITGQKPAVVRARKSIAQFKLREGMPIGAKVTLRGDRMWEFLDRLLSLALPRIRDFRGLNPKQFDGHGNYTFGLNEQSMFREIDVDRIDRQRGMDITLVTTATNDEEGRELLTPARLPLRRPARRHHHPLSRSGDRNQWPRRLSSRRRTASPSSRSAATPAASGAVVRTRSSASSACAGSACGRWPTPGSSRACASPAGEVTPLPQPRSSARDRPGRTTAPPIAERPTTAEVLGTACGTAAREAPHAMTMTDPIADMLTRLRNANQAYHDSAAMPSSKLKTHIAEILQQEGYIAGWTVNDVEKDGSTFKQLVIDLKYGPNRERSIAGVRRVSKPGLRVYAKSTSLPKVLGGLGVAIISTSTGLLTDKQANKKGVGGEVLAYVW